MKKIIILSVIYFLILVSLVIFGSEEYYQTYINVLVICISSLGFLGGCAVIVDKDKNCKQELEKFLDKFFN